VGDAYVIEECRATSSDPTTGEETCDVAGDETRGGHVGEAFVGMVNGIAGAVAALAQAVVSFFVRSPAP
jgi:hypothetical protein